MNDKHLVYDQYLKPFKSTCRSSKDLSNVNFGDNMIPRISTHIGTWCIFESCNLQDGNLQASFDEVPGIMGG